MEKELPVGGASISAEGDIAFPRASIDAAERFVTESTIAQSCLGYILSILLRKYEPVTDLHTATFVEALIKQLALFGLVAVNKAKSPKVVPLFEARFYARWDPKHSEYSYYAMRLDHRADQTPIPVAIMREPDVTHRRFNSPVLTAIRPHLNQKLATHVQLETSKRNLERPVYSVRPDNEESIHRSIQEGQHLMSRVLYGMREANAMGLDQSTQFFDGVGQVRERNADNARRRADTELKRHQADCDIASFTTLGEYLPTSGNYNRVMQADRGTTFATLPETRLATGLHDLLTYTDSAICDCFGVTIGEIHRDAKSSGVKNSSGGEAAQVSPQAQATIDRFSLTLNGILDQYPTLKLKPRQKGNPRLEISKPEQVIQMVQAGLIDFSTARDAMGFNAANGPSGHVVIEAPSSGKPPAKSSKSK